MLYPVFVRRMDLIRLKPDGEDPRTYLQRINRFSLEANFQSLDCQSFCILHFTKTIEDDHLRDEIFKLGDPTYAETLQFVTNYTSNKRSDKAVGKGDEVHHMDAFKMKTCMRCGKSNHQSKQCKVLEKGLSCLNCRKKGHLAIVCQSKRSQPVRPPRPMHTFRTNGSTFGDDNNNVNSAEDDIIDLIHMEVTPCLKATIIHDGGSFWFDVFPDSGGTACLVLKDLVQKYGLEMRCLKNLPKFQAINGELLSVEGLVCIKISNDANLLEIPITAIVSVDVKNEILIGFQALTELGVISRKFPMAKFICDNKLLRIKKELCKEYNDMIRDTLPSSPMHGDPMRIELKEGAIPYKVLTAQKMPKHWEKQANQIVDQLLEKKVIEWVEEPTAWTAPGFWVAKNDGKGIHLVVDLSKLNKYIVRPMHPFPSAMDIVSGIEKGAKYFAKLDAVMGFHQIQLDSALLYLTTFLILQGRFWWLRCPMGSCTASDKWCC